MDNISDLSNISLPDETIERWRQMMQPMAEAIKIAQENAKKIITSIAPVRSELAKLNEPLKELTTSLTPILGEIAKQAEPLKELAFVIAKAFRPLTAMRNLAEAQYVFWDRFTDEFTYLLASTSNIDKTLLEFHIADNFFIINQTIEFCGRHKLIKVYERIWSQTINAYQNGHYDLAAIGFISVIDGLLSDTSGEINNTSIFTRAKNILEKITEDEETIESCDFGIATLATTFEATMESLCTKSDFSGNEPDNLNRHWIIHGRSKREKTQLDCIKLINFIRGILLISDLAKEK